MLLKANKSDRVPCRHLTATFLPPQLVCVTSAALYQCLPVLGPHMRITGHSEWWLPTNWLWVSFTIGSQQIWWLLSMLSILLDGCTTKMANSKSGGENYVLFHWIFVTSDTSYRTNSTSEGFNVRQKCISRQYSCERYSSTFWRPCLNKLQLTPLTMAKEEGFL